VINGTRIFHSKLPGHPTPIGLWFDSVNSEN
jgi:hypothetical protein